MYDPVSEGVEAGTEPGLFASAMRFSPYILATHCAGRATIGPNDGEGYEDKEGAELCWIGAVGVLNVEATRLGVRKEAFHVPSSVVEIEAARAVVEIGCDNQQFAFPDALCREVQPAFGDCFHSAEPARPCSAAVFSQKSGKIAHAAVVALEPHLFLEADHEWEIVFVEEFDTIRADELSVCQERLDRGRAEEAHIPFHQSDPLRGVKTTSVLEQCPHRGYPEPTCHECQNETVYLARSKRPLRPIEREQPWLRKVQYPHNQPCGRVRVEPDERKEPLQATIV